MMENRSAGESRANEAVERLRTAFAAILAEVRKSIVGQEEIVEQLLIAVFLRGHCLLEGVPGLGKTLLVRSLSRALARDFHRIQFTPDLMPTDITGAEVLEAHPGTHEITRKTVVGPVFTNLLLADEINRTPPKTQAALLEAMEERQVTIGNQTHALPDPFFVLATQNPLEQEGTYPLPEAQLDRFLFKIRLDYPSAVEEKEILRTVIQKPAADIQQVVSAEELRGFQALVRQVPVPEATLDHAAALVRATRPSTAQNAGWDDVAAIARKHLVFGAGPRGAIYWIQAAQVHALLHGRYHVAREDLDALLLPSLRHRIALRFESRAEGIEVDQVLGWMQEAAERVLEPA
jgi:MoxR-like ATPase